MNCLTAVQVLAVISNYDVLCLPVVDESAWCILEFTPVSCCLCTFCRQRSLCA
jgi:hypothetical protein